MPLRVLLDFTIPNVSDWDRIHRPQFRSEGVGSPLKQFGPSRDDEIRVPLRPARHTATTWTSAANTTRLSFAFGPENREEMAVHVSEVRDPLRRRGLVWLGGKGNSLSG
jgi:hypothetical protein